MMQNDMHDRAAVILGEMMALGAQFEIKETGNGRTFVWRGRPPSCRDAIARYWNSVAKPTGLRRAMVELIERQQLDRVGGLAL